MKGNNNHHRNGNAGPTTTRTILRIKRRRTDEALPCIRLEGLDGKTRSSGSGKRGRDASPTETLDDNSNNNNNNAPPRSTTALWKRFEPQADEDNYRIVNAMLLSSNDDDEADGDRKTKRRRLTVLETTTSDLPSVVSMPRIKQPFRVLDPLTRMVDDSLQEVHIGNKRVAEHYHFITTDSQLMYESKKWLAWCHGEGGNLLHACALWNDVEMANELLTNGCGHGDCSTLTEAVDADGRTPYEVAQLSGHDSVCEILEAFGGDTSNFVYDIFCLDEDDPNNGGGTAMAGGGTGMNGTANNDNNMNNDASDNNNNNNDYGNDQPMAVELTSGVGYWTPDGELVLEAPEKSPASLTHVFDEDGEIDSNCEEYGGNDYPEDEDWGDDFVYNNNNNSSNHRPHSAIDMYSPEEADYNDYNIHSGWD